MKRVKINGQFFKPVNYCKKTGRFYLDCRGKDISFDRWRICFYYHRNFATTVFFHSEKRYNEYITENDNGYKNYTKFAEENNYYI